MRSARRSGIGCAAILSVVVAASPYTVTRGAGAADSSPYISSVTVSGSPGAYTFSVAGTGFGPAPVHLPYAGDTPDFRIGDLAQLGDGEYGYSGDAEGAHLRSVDELADRSLRTGCRARRRAEPGRLESDLPGCCRMGWSGPSRRLPRSEDLACVGSGWWC